MVVANVRRLLKPFGLALGLILLLAQLASAYTIIMKGGRRIEVPVDFRVTPTTLTYEVSSGIQVTLLMSAVDIASTERANKEPVGSLLRRVQTVLSKTPLDRASNRPASKESLTHTVTDKDLEAFKTKRRQSELLYEKRRRELGLPSLEESRRMAAAELVSMDETFARKRGAEAESENYWRERASELRTEMEALDAEIGYGRQRLAETEPNLFSGSVGFVGGGLPFGGFGLPFGGGFKQPFHGWNSSARPNIVIAPRAGGRSSVGFAGGGSRARICEPWHVSLSTSRWTRSSWFSLAGHVCLCVASAVIRLLVRA